MRKSWACCLLAVLALSGCSGASTQSSEFSTAPPAATVTATSKPSTSSAAATKKASTREEMVRDIYLEAIYESEPALKSAGAGEDLVSIGQGFCDMYDGGAVGTDINNYILTAAGWAYTVPQLVAVHGAAVGAYCPQHEDKMSL
ncbi:DUF732 domain-containing protein [Paenarthrobacter sp. PAE-2]|uniref:DUF732 domain-containing protein n=1 Tax=Paenarthrobacter sp. PAE-2 TaxID=2982532 RepID=UPI002230C0D4|nr:DUF732 domain-containing protein [Paenarthrobacter sp. PAE-2]MCW3768898.1 DUF732 domain-containing protein [Paenarthrobacter sp. PAE-2]